MEELLEILRQINELSGVALDALEQATGAAGSGNGPAPEEGGAPPQESAPPVPPGQ